MRRNVRIHLNNKKHFISYVWLYFIYILHDSTQQNGGVSPGSPPYIFQPPKFHRHTVVHRDIQIKAFCQKISVYIWVQYCQLKLLKCLKYKLVNSCFTIMNFIFHCWEISLSIFVIILQRKKMPVFSVV